MVKLIYLITILCIGILLFNGLLPYINKIVETMDDKYESKPIIIEESKPIIIEESKLVPTEDANVFTLRKAPKIISSPKKNLNSLNVLLNFDPLAKTEKIIHKSYFDYKTLPDILKLNNDFDTFSKCTLGSKFRDMLRKTGSTKNPPVVALTTLTRPYLDHISTRDPIFKSTIWEQESINNLKKLKIPMIIYNENIWDIKHNRIPMYSFEHENILQSSGKQCFFDIFKTSPHLLDYTFKEDDHSMNEFYRYKGTPGLNPNIMDGKPLIRKVLAIWHVMNIVPKNSVVLWLDVDVTVSVNSFPSDLLEFVQGKEISFITETNCWNFTQNAYKIWDLPDYCHDFKIDTGVTFITVNEKSLQLVELMIRLYDGLMIEMTRICLDFNGSGKIFRNGNDNYKPTESNLDELYYFLISRNSNSIKTSAEKLSEIKQLCKDDGITSNLGLNDIYVLGFALHILKDLKVGWFAHEKQSLCNINPKSAPDKKLPGGLCNPCPTLDKSTNKLVSPFRITPYFNHLKGGKGIMSRQHFKNGKAMEVFTPDEELKLPKQHFPISSHIDHRLACYDKRGEYLKTWSLKQDMLLYKDKQH